MSSNKIMKILAAMFAMRSKYWDERGDHGIGGAYSDAFDMLAYAARGSWDNLSQFGWSDEAEDLINRVGDNIDFWDLEDLIQKGEETQQ